MKKLVQDKDTLLEKEIKRKKEEVRKTSKLSQKTLAHLEVLKKYYDVDMEKRVITITLKYDDVNELIDETLSTAQKPVFKRDLLSKMSSVAHTLPYEFKISINLQIINYRRYSPNVLKEALIDTFELFLYDVRKENTYSRLKVAALIVMGVIVLAWLFYFCSKHWFGTQGQPDHDTIHELVYTVGGVVLWEAVYIIFLPSYEYEGISKTLLYKINEIYIVDKNKRIISNIHRNEIINSIKVDTKAERRSRMFLLIAGTAILCLSGCGLTDVVEAFINQPDGAVAIVKATFTIVMVIIGVFAGFGAISYFRDKGPFKGLVLGFSIATIILSIARIIFTGLWFKQIGTGTAIKAIVLTSLILILSIVYLICVVILRKKKPVIEQPNVATK